MSANKRGNTIELWDLYNENRELTGKTHIRGEEIPDGFFHLVVHVWIRNSKGEYLISQCSANRPAWPLMWETVGGSVLAGEGSLTGAIRETKEEIGIDLLPNSGTLLFSKIRNDIPGIKPDHFLDVWLFQYDGSVPLSDATTDEVAQSKWMTRSDIERLKLSGKLVKTLYYFFDEVDKQ